MNLNGRYNGLKSGAGPFLKQVGSFVTIESDHGTDGEANAAHLCQTQALEHQTNDIFVDVVSVVEFILTVL